MSDVIFFQIFMDGVEDIPLSQAPQRGEKGVFVTVSCQSVDNDILSQAGDTVPYEGYVFLFCQRSIIARFVNICQVAVGKNMKQLQFDPVDSGTMRFTAPAICAETGATLSISR